MNEGKERNSKAGTHMGLRRWRAASTESSVVVAELACVFVFVSAHEQTN